MRTSCPTSTGTGGLTIQTGGVSIIAGGFSAIVGAGGQAQPAKAAVGGLGDQVGRRAHAVAVVVK